MYSTQDWKRDAGNIGRKTKKEGKKWLKAAAKGDAFKLVAPTHRFAGSIIISTLWFTGRRIFNK